MFFNFSGQEKKPAEKIKDDYVKGLDELGIKLQKLRETLRKPGHLVSARPLFLQCRLSFKKIAWLIEYFNPYEARLLNGPALKRTEEDNPQTVIEPRGFQVLEEILFEAEEPGSRAHATTRVEDILQTLQRLRYEEGLVYKFQDDVLFSAARAALVRLASMGISGFDSPVAGYSLPEARAALEGVMAGIRHYQPLTGVKERNLFDIFRKQGTAAVNFLSSVQRPEKFNHLGFLRKHLDPLFGTLTTLRDRLNIPAAPGLMPVNQQAKSLFDPFFFNLDFFSPNESYRVNAERIMLGKKLFSDPILSGTKNRSCATCHQAGLAFTDGLAVPPDIDGNGFLTRNTPTLWNSVFQTRQFFDSRTATLENQLSDVVHNSKEMKGSLQETIPELKKDPEYAALFRAAYAKEPEQITQYNIANAIASYIRSLVALNSRFDQYMRGDETKMNMAERNGFNLFMGKAKCGTCHYIPLFNGLVPPDFNETESEVLGVPQSKDSIRPRLDPDEGKYNFTRSEVHRFAFKTPTLRNIELTAPYMHNGVYNTLEEVMDFYNKGGGGGLGIAPEYQTLPPDKLNLTRKEISDIIAFLKTLTDTTGSYQARK